MSADRIHFLNTGYSDCIIIESQGHFAMVDSAEDSDYPENKPQLKNLKGYEDTVVNYLLENCMGDDGFVTLDFILGTHAHSDHIGGFDTVLLNPKIKVKQAYLRKYNEKYINIMERTRWDNQEVYDQMVEALKKTNTPLCQDFNGKSFKMGNFTITFMHGPERHGIIKYGENINSVVTLVEKNGTKVLLAGDMNNKCDDEKVIAQKVGKIHLLKAGHHGHPFSNGYSYIKAIEPDYAIVTNSRKNILPLEKYILTKVGRSEILTTVEENGIIAVIKNNGYIDIHRNIMHTVI